MIKLSFNPKAIPTIIISPKKENVLIELQNGSRRLDVGIGERKNMTRRKLILVARQIVALARTHRLKSITVNFDDFNFPHLQIPASDLAELLATNFEMANFQFVKYKTPPPDGWAFVKEIQITGRVSPEVKKAFKKGQIIGDEVNRCRELSNTPGGEMTPSILAKDARSAIRGTSLRIKVFDKKALQRMNMGGILGVGKGSSEPPCFIVLEYLKGPRNESPIVLVGKGVTFDTGGLNVKPENYMNEMHMDMSGGAAVISALVLAHKLNLKKNIIGLIPAVENMPSGSSYHPGDVLKTHSGKTIEVLNTDAEGRIILADALSYAAIYKPRLIVDVATLTGAAMAALGQRASGLFTKEEKLEKLFRDLGEETGDFVWPLPLWDEYEEEVKGTFGDWANLGKGRYGGAITGAIFLYQFVKNKNGKPIAPWVHLDIAPRMTAIDGEYLSKGAAGAPVRLLTKLLERF